MVTVVETPFVSEMKRVSELAPDARPQTPADIATLQVGCGECMHCLCMRTVRPGQERDRQADVPGQAPLYIHCGRHLQLHRQTAVRIEQ